MPMNTVCAAALPTRALSTGERCADDSVYANEMYEEALEEAIEVADEDEPTDANEHERGRSRSPTMMLKIPRSSRLSLIMARSAWMIQ
jgi:hypothetical protein